MSKARLAAACLALASFALPDAAAARTICALVADAENGATLLEQGDCHQRTTPASTFKIALAVIGFDVGVLKDGRHPEYMFRSGYVDWGGEAWRQPTDPTRWLKYSVVWYSQRIAHQLGAPRLEAFLRKFHYGNADMSGDPGQNNGLDRAWIGSSLKISPLEQMRFLRKLLAGELPVSRQAMAQTRAIIEKRSAGDGWEIFGKTGSAFPRGDDGEQDLDHGYGWFVGWAERDRRKLIFVRCDQDERREALPGGLRARDALIAEWPQLAAQALGSASTASQTGGRRHTP